MKTLLALVLAASTTSAIAETANYFTCVGKDINISMSTTSKTGKPSLSVNDSDFGVAALSKVAYTENVMGIQTTGSFDGINDASLNYTLIVPSVVLKDAALPKIEGMVVRTLTDGFLAPGADQYPHARQINTFIPVVCTAQFAQF